MLDFRTQATIGALLLQTAMAEYEKQPGKTRATLPDEIINDIVDQAVPAQLDPKLVRNMANILHKYPIFKCSAVGIKVMDSRRFVVNKEYIEHRRQFAAEDSRYSEIVKHLVEQREKAEPFSGCQVTYWHNNFKMFTDLAIFNRTFTYRLVDQFWGMTITRWI